MLANFLYETFIALWKGASVSIRFKIRPYQTILINTCYNFHWLGPSVDISCNLRPRIRFCPFLSISAHSVVFVDFCWFLLFGEFSLYLTIISRYSLSVAWSVNPYIHITIHLYICSLPCLLFKCLLQSPPLIHYCLFMSISVYSCLFCLFLSVSVYSCPFLSVSIRFCLGMLFLLNPYVYTHFYSLAVKSKFIFLSWKQVWKDCLALMDTLTLTLQASTQTSISGSQVLEISSKINSLLANIKHNHQTI